jgi:dihydrodipicolinate synthase/N-acetylneuraminate lyase
MSRFAGIFPVLQTPFDEKGEIDTDSLRAEVEFCLQAGAHGLVVPATASEFFALTDSERFRVAEIVLEQTCGRVPVIVGTSGVSKQAAVAFTAHAVAHGADGIMAMPPYVRRPDEASVFAYYEAVAEAARDRPVIVQNAPPPLGTPLSVPALVRLMERVENIRYVKEEVSPAGPRISALNQTAGGRLLGVFGGSNGLWLLNELDHGACGNMPASALVDVHVRIYTLYTSGKREEAEALSLKILPLLNLGSQFGVAFAKELLRMRGVIRTAVVRDPQASTLDEIDIAELKRYWERLNRELAVGDGLC